MRDEDKQPIQETIDRLLYCGEKYREDLDRLNKKYDPHKKVNYSTEPTKFRFPLSAAI